jgi:hypothetical protein
MGGNGDLTRPAVIDAVGIAVAGLGGGSCYQLG